METIRASLNCERNTHAQENTLLSTLLAKIYSREMATVKSERQLLEMCGQAWDPAQNINGNALWEKARSQKNISMVMSLGADECQGLPNYTRTGCGGGPARAGQAEQASWGKSLIQAPLTM